MRLIEFAQHSITPLLHHSASSPDHPIRPRQHIRRNRQADLLRGFQIDDELELLRLLHWQVGGLGAFQDLVYIRSGAPVTSRSDVQRRRS